MELTASQTKVVKIIRSQPIMKKEVKFMHKFEGAELKSARELKDEKLLNEVSGGRFFVFSLKGLKELI